MVVKGTSGDKPGFPHGFGSRKENNTPKKEGKKNPFFCGRGKERGRDKLKTAKNTHNPPPQTPPSRNFPPKLYLCNALLLFLFSNQSDNKRFLKLLTQNTVPNATGQQGFSRQWQSQASASTATLLTSAHPWQHLQEDAPLVNPSVPCRGGLGLTQISSACPKEEHSWVCWRSP